MSGRPFQSKVRPDLPLLEHHYGIVAQFLAEHPSKNEQDAFDAAWPAALAYEELATSKVPADKQGRRKRVRDLRKLSNKIVPATRQAAAPSRVAIHRAALRWLRKCGGVENFNISKFAKYVQSLPSAQRISRKHGTSRALTDHAIRAILKERLDLVGKPGRKRKTL